MFSDLPTEKKKRTCLARSSVLNSFAVAADSRYIQFSYVSFATLKRSFAILFDGSTSLVVDLGGNELIGEVELIWIIG